MLFSQLHVPLEVLAEEITENNDTTVEKEDAEKKEEVGASDDNLDDTTLDNDAVTSDNDTSDNATTDDTKSDVTIDNSDDETKNEVSDDSSDDTTGEASDETKNEVSDDSSDDTTGEASDETKNEVSDDSSDNTTGEDSDETKNDEQNTDDVKEYKYTITINGKEVDEEYTITDTKVLSIHQEYNGEDGTYKFLYEDETVDFSHSVYGEYRFHYIVVDSDDVSNNLAEKDIVIHYNGDNKEILDKYTNLSYKNDAYNIRGKSEKLTAGDVKSNFDLVSLGEEYYFVRTTASGSVTKNSATIDVFNGNTLLSDSDEIDYSCVVFLNIDSIGDSFPVSIEGDYNGDGIVNKDDAKAVVNNILFEVTQDDGTPFSILDATNSVFYTGVWDEDLGVNDELESSLSNKNEVYVGEEFTVEYYINGFDKDIMRGIEGTITYDKDLLELTSFDINSIYGGINENDKFAFLLDDYNTNGLLLTWNFVAKASGDANIYMNDVILSNGNILNLVNNSVKTNVTIVDLPKGGDTEEDQCEESTTSYSSGYVDVTNNGVAEPVYIPRYVELSGDNYIKSLKIDGYKIDFDMYKYEYNINVGYDVKSLKLDVVLNDPSATYEVKGNKNFKVGDNVVEIIVTAENGDTRTYTINVKKDSEELKVKKVNDGSAKPIIILLIVLVIIGLIYVIFKDDEDDKGSK